MSACALRNRIKQLAARPQNAEETAETLSASDVFPTVFELGFNYEVNTFERQPFQSSLSREANISGTKQTNVNFQLEPKGSGTAGTRPNYADLMLACGFAEVKLCAVTVSGATGGPLTVGDTLTDGDGSTYYLFTQPRSATELICFRLTGAGTPTTLTMSGPGSYSATYVSVNENYGWGFKPHSVTTQTIALDDNPAFIPGETVTGGTSGATGRVIYMGSSNLWFQPLSGTFQSGETITGSVSGVDADSTAVPACSLPTPPLTIYVNQDGVRTTAKGCRGRVNMNFGAVGEPGRMEFEFQGPEAANPSDTAAFAESSDSLIPPKFQGATLALDDPADPFNPVVSQMNIQTDNTLSPRLDATDSAGIRSVIITQRDFVGAFDPEMVAVGEYTFHADWFNDTLRRFYAKIGSANGNIVEFYGEKFQLTNVGFDNRDDILLAGSQFRFVRVVADDALQIVVR